LNQITRLEKYLGLDGGFWSGREERAYFSLLNYGHHEMLFKINLVRLKYYMIIYHVLQKKLKHRFSPPKPSQTDP